MSDFSSDLDALQRWVDRVIAACLWALVAMLGFALAGLALLWVAA